MILLRFILVISSLNLQIKLVVESLYLLKCLYYMYVTEIEKEKKKLTDGQTNGLTDGQTDR